MSHLDDGTIAELIDGELEDAARDAALLHLAECAACRARHEESRSFATESDRLIATVAPPRAVRGVGLPPTARPGWRVPWRTLGWAASVLLATGIGYYAGVPGEVAGVPESPRAVRPAADPQELARSEAPAPVSPAPQAGDETRSQAAADTPARPPELAKREAQAAAPAERDRQSVRAFALAPAAEAPLAQGKSAPQAADLATVSMEEALPALGGTIRLIDGMTPRQLRRLVPEPGAGPGNQEGVRVVYLDPPSRELWLDQRRLAAPGEDAAKAGNLLAGDTILVTLADGRRRLEWLDPAGFHLSLSGFLPADSLRSLAGRIR